MGIRQKVNYKPVPLELLVPPRIIHGVTEFGKTTEPGEAVPERTVGEADYTVRRMLPTKLCGAKGNVSAENGGCFSE